MYFYMRCNILLISFLTLVKLLDSSFATTKKSTELLIADILPKKQIYDNHKTNVKIILYGANMNNNKLP